MNLLFNVNTFCTCRGVVVWRWHSRTTPARSSGGRCLSVWRPSSRCSASAWCRDLESVHHWLMSGRRWIRFFYLKWKSVPIYPRSLTRHEVCSHCFLGNMFFIHFLSPVTLSRNKLGLPNTSLFIASYSGDSVIFGTFIWFCLAALKTCIFLFLFPRIHFLGATCSPLLSVFNWTRPTLAYELLTECRLVS